MNQIAFLGLSGSFSFIAAQKYFGNKARFLGTNSTLEIIEKVENGLCNFGILPIENSLTGSVYETYDLLNLSKLSINGEIILHIHHQLLGKRDGKIKLCYSHPQALAQCRRFFNNNPDIQSVLTKDTSSAAKIITQFKRKDAAAIAGKMVAKIYGLKILKSDIEDNPHNFTRFVVLAKIPSNKGNKISLLFSVDHKPGSLFSALYPYSRLGFNLTKIESRPVFGTPWEYVFFLDFEFNGNQNNLKMLFAQMKKHVNYLKILGKYNKGKSYET